MENIVEDKMCNIPIKFQNIDNMIIDKIKKELYDAIKYFENNLDCYCRCYIKEIIVKSEELKSEAGEKVNGIFNKGNRVLTLNSDMLNVKKYRNTIIHELCHAKFNTDLCINENELFKKYLYLNDPVIYLIDEYIACKNASDYSYDLNEIRQFYKLQESYLYNKKNSSSKGVATLVSMIIVSDELLRRKKEKTKRIFIAEIKNIKMELEKINFIPTLEQYEDLKRVMLKYKFIEL